MTPRLLLRAAQVARHPPSRRRVAVGLVAIGLVILLAAIEAVWSWPAALSPERASRLPGLPRG